MTAGAAEPAAGALRWLADLLGGARIRFLVAGEAAAAAHGAAPPAAAPPAAAPPAAAPGAAPPAAAPGAAPPAAGIEVFVAAADLPRLLRLAEAEIVEPPWRRRDDHWDRVAVVLERDRTRITVSVREAARVRDAATGAWVDAAIDLGASVARMVGGVTVPVMAWEPLAALERRMGRAPARPAAGADGGGRR